MTPRFAGSTGAGGPRYGRRSRRDVLRGVAALGLGAWAVAGTACGSGGKEGGSGPAAGAGSSAPAGAAGVAGAPKKGGTVTIGHPQFQVFASMDPIFNTYLGTGLIVQNHRDAGLLEFTTDMKLTGGLAEKWEIPAEGREVVLTLRQGATFQDETPVTAESVVWSLEHHFAKNPGYPKGQKEPVVLPEKMEAVDGRTVKLTLKAPAPALLQDLTHIEMGTVMSKAAMAKADDPYGYVIAANAPVTAGPFKVTEFTAKQSLRMKSYAGYYGGAPNLDQVDFKIVPEDATRTTLLFSGDAQIIANVPPQDIARIKGNPTLEQDTRPGQKVIKLSYSILKPNGPWGPSTDPKAIARRQAVAYAIDTKAIIDKILLGQGKAADSIMAPYQFGYAAGKPYAFDPKKAKELLNQSGWDWNYTISLNVPQGAYTADREVGTVVQAMLKEIGLKVDLKVWSDNGQYADMIGSREASAQSQWDLGISPFSMLPLPENRLHGILNSKNGLAQYNSDEMDNLVNKLIATPNDTERQSLLKKIQEISLEHLPYAPLYYQGYTIAWNKKLKNVVVMDAEAFDLRKAYLDS